MPQMKTLRIIGLLASGLSLFSMPAWAEKADRDKPMLIEADAMRHDESKLLTIFTGQVVAFKGTMVLRAERVELRERPDGYREALDILGAELGA